MRKQWVLMVVALGTLVCLPAIAAHAQEVSLSKNTPAVQASDSSGASALLRAAHSIDLMPSAPPSPVARVAPAPPAGSTSTVDIFAGYSYLSNAYVDRFGDHGWNLQATWNVSPHVGITADFSGHNGSHDFTIGTGPGAMTEDIDHDFYYFLFGPKLTHHAGQFDVYAHALVGVAHARSGERFGTGVTSVAKDTNFATGVGGGVDYMAFQHWGVRLLQVDYLFSQLNETPVTFPSGFLTPVHNIRVSAGVIWRW